MSVLPEGPIWFHHSSLATKNYKPSDPKQFYDYMLLEVVINRERYHRQGMLAPFKGHPRTIEINAGYADGEGPSNENNQVNYRKWKYTNAMYGPDARSITKRVRLESTVPRGELMHLNEDHTSWKAARVRFVPIPMPTSIEKYVWIDLLYPIRAIYLPQQHQVDDGMYKEWCSFQHLSFRRRTTSFNAYDFVKWEQVPLGDLEQYAATVDGKKYTSGNQYLLEVIEKLSSKDSTDHKGLVSNLLDGLSGKEEKGHSQHAPTKSLSELKEMHSKSDPSLRTALEAKLEELCEVAVYKEQRSRRRLKAQRQRDERLQKLRKQDQQRRMGLMHQQTYNWSPAKYPNLHHSGKKAEKHHDTTDAAIKSQEAKAKDTLLSDAEMRKLYEKAKHYLQSFANAQKIDREVDERKNNRLKVNQYKRKDITMTRNDSLGWDINIWWMVRLDVAQIYASLMIPRGWLLPECQSPYSGVAMFSINSIEIPDTHHHQTIDMYSDDNAIDIVKVLGTEWGVQLTDDTPPQPDFIIGLCNEILKVGLSLVPVWGPLLYYGDTVLYNLIFTDKFEKLKEGGKDEIAEFGVVTVCTLLGSKDALQKMVRMKAGNKTKSVFTPILHVS